MRTTLSIDDDVLAAARSLARLEGRSLGAVISELARRGLAPRSELSSRGGFPAFAVSVDASPLTPSMVREAADEDALVVIAR